MNTALFQWEGHGSWELLSSHSQCLFCRQISAGFGSGRSRASRQLLDLFGLLWLRQWAAHCFLVMHCGAIAMQTIPL